MFALISFSDKFHAWSAFVFWTVLVSVLITLAFTLVVFVGGIADLRFLLRAMNQPLDGDDQDGQLD